MIFILNYLYTRGDGKSKNCINYCSVFDGIKKFVLEQAMEAQRGSRGIALLFI
jgi:hypothetical protein